MGKQHTEISTDHQAFIEQQKLFFVATAGAEGRVNLSPKGMDSLRVLGPNRVVWLNLTGSGNETSAHVQENGRMTLMFTAFEGKPVILRLYGTAEVVHRNDAAWEELSSHFPLIPGTRQFFDLEVDLVQDSCGMAVPFFDYAGPRDQLKDWATKQGPDGIEQYWEKKNQVSLDGRPTHIMQRNT